MKTSSLIPARFSSTRFPGKPLVELKLTTGESRSLIRLTWKAANRVQGADEVHVDTDDGRSGWPLNQLETLEGLEQLRLLVNGMPVKCVQVDGRGRVFWELNNSTDVPRIGSALKELVQ